MKIVIMNGVNLNMLGIREKNVYGDITLAEINKRLERFARENFSTGVELEFFQSNIEGEIVNAIHKAALSDGVILNAGAFTHYSYAIHDAIKCIPTVPVIEVHMSNINAREEFRRISVIAPACIGSISGFGAESYKLAITYLAALCRA